MARAFVRAGRLAATVLVFLALGGCGVRNIDWQNTGAPAGTGFLHKTIEYDGQPRRYVVFVPHDYANGKDRTVVLFRGRVVETGVTSALLAAPQHSYTQRLIECA